MSFLALFSIIKESDKDGWVNIMCCRLKNQQGC